MDRRQRKTKDAIFRAFINLMKRKSYSQITVQQIIDEADIGRTTFYVHFETKDDLLKAICDEIFSHILSNDIEKEKSHDFSSLKSIESRLTHLLYHLKDNWDYISGIMANESNDIFTTYFKQYLLKLFDGNIKTNNSANIPKDYIMNHMVSDLIETIRWWIKHPEYNPEEISEFYLVTTPFISN